jgi:hypothetical protein
MVTDVYSLNLINYDSVSHCSDDFVCYSEEVVNLYLVVLQAMTTVL